MENSRRHSRRVCAGPIETPSSSADTICARGGGRGFRSAGAEMTGGKRGDPGRLGSSRARSLVFSPPGRGHSPGPLVSHMELPDSTGVSLECCYAPSLAILRPRPSSTCTRPLRDGARKTGIHVSGKLTESHRAPPIILSPDNANESVHAVAV